jgi:hypothetical protein
MSLAFYQYTYTLLCFYCCLLVVYNLQPLHISAYLTYIGLDSSNLYNCNKAQHTPSIQLFCCQKPLCHPCKIAPSHVTMMEKCDISSHPEKNQCLLEEGPWVPIVSLNVCTSRAPRCCLCSQHHKSSTPLQQEKIPCIYGIFF